MGEFGEDSVTTLDPIKHGELVTILKKHNIVLGRLHIVDGNILEMTPIKMKVGIIDLYFENNHLVYDENEGLYLDDNYYGETKSVLYIIEHNLTTYLNYRLMKVAAEVIDVLNRIKNVNYYVMEN
jgi:hypothetical protein